ncbi:DUF1707 domain-containing protein [Acidipropionibacterium acidipropionici]|uniref:DUF1707 domain-containing protein n=1 Tax=Acidipropionibacterium acidipropionici TaxID=1748 RepID=A0AAC8YEQ2_9ACTN|nr:DUF1707 domain-containing protein [Acidipropionibacterium acidipropionici]AMS05059.1 hypothetical protein AXH35_05830 [Acidipropionibacterium acidipropionici]AOZ46540.1 hypothetical protein A8L58_07295 [Acidipropionibacterium acidipropionici]AZP37408.1 DUF1707 domain-containing protein [Acidipropionibacterium acidipropionici]QCV94448.1 DUF1707 domain-containing protein [Acidipropionibacterium acidipropionici]
MNELPPSSKYVARAAEPVTDADRADLNTWLNDAYSDGKIDESTFREGLDTVYSAATLGDLVPVVAGLPTRQTYAEPALGTESSTAPGELTPHRALAPSTTLWLAVGGGVLVLLLLILAVVLIF